MKRMKTIQGAEIIKKVEEGRKIGFFTNAQGVALVVCKEKMGLNKTFNTRIDYNDGLTTLDIDDTDNCCVLLITDLGDLENILNLEKTNKKMAA